MDQRTVKRNKVICFRISDQWYDFISDFAADHEWSLSKAAYHFLLQGLILGKSPTSPSDQEVAE